MSPKQFLLLSVLVLVTASAAWPQASTSTVRGIVRDQSNAVIPNAAVTLTNTATNVATRTSTNEVGFYVLPGVVPGPYRLSVEASGMQKYEATLTVQVQQVAVVDPVLKVGQTATEVRVEDVTPMVTMDNPTLGHVLERQRIEQLPVNGRYIFTLSQTVPGIEGGLGTRAFGVRDGAHEYLMDGAPFADRMWGSGAPASTRCTCRTTSR